MSSDMSHSPERKWRALLPAGRPSTPSAGASPAPSKSVRSSSRQFPDFSPVDDHDRHPRRRRHRRPDQKARRSRLRYIAWPWSTVDAAARLGEIKRRFPYRSWPTSTFPTLWRSKAIAQGVDKVRINPGNIGPAWKVAEVVKAAKDKGSDSHRRQFGLYPRGFADRIRPDDPRAFVGAALRELEFWKSTTFTIHYRPHHRAFSAPSPPIRYLRISSTTLPRGDHRGRDAVFRSIKSAVGIGVILARGIGDTIRVSLTADPVEESESASRFWPR